MPDVVPSDVRTFIDRWKDSGASERANFQPFLTELCDLLGVSHPDPAQAEYARNDYVFERVVRFEEGEGKTSSRFIDLYRKGCFVMEAKQGSDAPGETESESYLGKKARRKMGTARRGTRGWGQAMERAKNQARRYARALPTEHGWPPLLIVVDVGYCFDVYADFTRQGKTYTQFPDAQRYRIMLEDLADAAVADAYGWPAGLDDDEIPERLVALNAERRAEEKQGLVRYLRPDYQNPEGTQQALEIDASTAVEGKGKEAIKQPWPSDLPERIQAVQRVVTATDRSATVEDVARRFKRARRAQVQDLLATLEALGHVRQTEEGRYVA